jgi:hypothetical protein
MRKPERGQEGKLVYLIIRVYNFMCSFQSPTNVRLKSVAMPQELLGFCSD